jgi:hypothetical protein
MESKQIKVLKNSIHKQQLGQQAHFEHLANHDHTLEKLDQVGE